MRMVLSVLLLGITALPGGECFVVQQRRGSFHHRIVRPIRVGGLGWDNDNFLSSLSGSDRDREDANDRYFQTSRYGRPEEGRLQASAMSSDFDGGDDELDEDLASDYTKGAELTADMVAKVKASHTPEEEASGGGKMFREMMNRAKQGNLQQQQAPQQQQQYYDPMQAPPQQYAPPPADQSASTMSIEDQARMFREMMQQQQQQGAAYPPPPPQPQPPQQNFLQRGVDSQGRKIGRNRDADAVVNSADVYFAQLKRDSSMRNIARHQGDDTTANAVFADPGIQEIKVQVNPYLEEQKKKEQDLLETVPEEMIEMYGVGGNANAESDKPKSYAGISYKAKLLERRNQKAGITTAHAPEPAPVSTPPPPPPAAVAPPPPPPPPEVKEEEPVVEAEMVVKDEDALQQETWAEKLAMEQATTVAFEKVATPPPPPAGPPVVVVEQHSPTATTTTPPPAAPPAEQPRTEDSTRKDIRTLMGLILKHRGGPGFGAGRLQGAEAQRLESLAGDVSAFLAQEAQQYPQQEGSEAAEPPPPQSSAVVSDPVSSSSYPPPQPEVAPVSSTTQVAADTSDSSSAIEPTITTPQGDRINSLLSCIEGAIQMYRNAPTELQEGVLITLRSALLSAVNSCNAIIAENEVKNMEAYRSVATDPRTRTRQQAPPPPEMPQPPPEPVLDVPSSEASIAPPPPPPAAPAVAEPVAAAASPPPAAATPSAAAPAKDDNSQFYEEVLAKLRSASGSGKMGLREDLSASEAADLSDSIAQMRSMLIEELDQGIPASSGSNSDAAAPAVPSKYEEMLAKARADKQAKM